jgi:hypothetical protein
VPTVEPQVPELTRIFLYVLAADVVIVVLIFLFAWIRRKLRDA